MAPTDDEPPQTTIVLLIFGSERELLEVPEAEGFNDGIGKPRKPLETAE